MRERERERERREGVTLEREREKGVTLERERMGVKNLSSHSWYTMGLVHISFPRTLEASGQD